MLRFTIALGLLLTLASVDARAQDRRVIVLGFDGVDPVVTRELIAAGDLPHLEALGEQGTFDELATTNPAESPVSWAAFTVGANPGHTGIFDFLHRVPGTYIPDIALVRRTERDLFARTWERVGLSAAAGLIAGLCVSLLLWLLLKWRGVTSRIRGRIALALLASVGLGVGWQVWVFIEKNVPRTVPSAENARDGTPFWRTAGEAGHDCRIIQVPVTFPAQPFENGELLSGLGTPDVRGTWGTFSIYGEDFPSEFSDPVNKLDRSLYIDGLTDSVTGGKVQHVEFAGGATEATATLWGPRDPTVKELRYIDREMGITIDREKKTATFAVDGHASVTAVEGGWSEWMRVGYEINDLITLRGRLRFRVRSLSPFYAYATPVNFDPADPPFLAPISAPASYAPELVERHGSFETVGWAIATNPLKDELIDEDEFLEALHHTFDRRWAVMKGELAREDWQLFTGVLLATDRVQHMFWRHRDQTHPIHPAAAPERHSGAIRDVYMKMDHIVGEVVDRYDDGNTDIWVISDHGFSSFRKGVHVNSWLLEEGLLALHDPEARTRGRLADIASGMPLAAVDWSRTKAYSLGLGKIYLNRRGREPGGIVEPDEVEPLRDRIIERLTALRDPDDGREVVRRVWRREELYTGPHLHEAADLVLGFNEGYRVSWDTAAGQVPPGIVENNTNLWSGDHCSVDPALVPGVVFTNRKLGIDDPSIIDLARTILGRLGVEPPAAMEGRNLLP